MTKSKFDWRMPGRFITAIAAIAALSTAAFAVDNNSTRIGPAREWHMENIYMGNGWQTNGHVATGFTYGIGPDKSTFLGRTEVGFDYVLSAGPFSGISIPAGQNPEAPSATTLFSGPTLSPGQRLFWGAKTQLYEDPKTQTRVVFGGYLWGVKEAYAPDLTFLAVSRQTKWGYFHAGYIHSFAGKEAMKTPKGNSDHDFWQLDYAKVVRPRLIAGFNFYSGRSRESAFFPAIIYFISDDYNTSVTVGDFIFNDASVRPTRDQFYVQFDYYFNGPSHDRRRFMPPPPPAPKAETPSGNTTPPQTPSNGGTAPAPPAPSGGGGVGGV